MYILLLPALTFLPVACTSSVTAPPKLAAPTEVRLVRLSAGSYVLRWNDRSQDEEGFLIERSFSASEGFEQIATVAADTTSWTVSGLDSTRTHYFRIAAFNSAGRSAYSPVVDTAHIIQHIGDLALDFTALDQNGQEVSLSDYPGRVIALYFNTYNTDT